MSVKKKFYAIREGKRSMVVVKTWDECSRLVTGHPGALFKGFGNESAALTWLADGLLHPGKKKTKSKAPGKKPTWDQDKYPCIERKTYRDQVTGVLYKNRCIRRRGPTMTGINYKPHIGNSLPWYTDDQIEEHAQLDLVSEARQRI